MLFGRPFGHIRPDFRKNGLRDRNADAIHGHQIYTRDPQQVAAQGDFVVGSILGIRTVLFLREFVWRLIRPIWLNEAIGVFDLGITSLDLSGVEIEEFQRLLEHKKMFCPPGACQGFGNLGRILFTAMVAQLG